MLEEGPTPAKWRVIIEPRRGLGGVALPSAIVVAVVVRCLNFICIRPFD